MTTMSLAGTQKFKPGVKPKWTTKELEEQELFTAYIVKTLKSKLKKLEMSSTESVKAGMLWHLKTTIAGVLDSSNSLKQIVEDLHPTPAVCGLPKDMAQDFILRMENYDRKYYTGFLGELNMEASDVANKNADPKTTLYVNLRCMELTKKEAFIYIGGGITEASDPEKEWQETEDKSSTMLQVIQGN